MVDTRYHDKPGRKEYIIQKNKELRKRRKLKLVKMKGGGCIICGYSKCMEALDFHHKDPKQKSFTLNQRNIGKAWVTVLAEAEKCDLLCANCHREIHTKEE